MTALASDGRRADDDHEPAWAVFRDRDEVQRAMTARVRNAVEENHGVRIAASADELALDEPDSEETVDARDD